MYYRGAAAAIVVYDITNRVSTAHAAHTDKGTTLNMPSSQHKLIVTLSLLFLFSLV